MEEQGESLKKRLDNLESQLADKRGKTRRGGDKQASGRGSSYSKAVKLSSEFIAGVLTGALLGYLFDYFLGTNPWGMIVFLLLGFAAAVLNMMRAAGYVETPQPKPRDEKKD